MLYVQNYFQWVVKCYAVYALWLQYELKEIVNATPMFTLDHYLPIISTFIFANSNSGCTCSTYILWPSLLPPTGLINTRSLLGRLKPESQDKILLNHFHSQECHSGSYQWPANSAAPHGIFSPPFSVILPQKEIFLYSPDSTVWIACNHSSHKTASSQSKTIIFSLHLCFLVLLTL